MSDLEKNLAETVKDILDGKDSDKYLSDSMKELRSQRLERQEGNGGGSSGRSDIDWAKSKDKSKSEEKASKGEGKASKGKEKASKGEEKTSKSRFKTNLSKSNATSIKKKNADNDEASKKSLKTDIDLDEADEFADELTSSENPLLTEGSSGNSGGSSGGGSSSGSEFDSDSDSDGEPIPPKKSIKEPSTENKVGYWIEKVLTFFLTLPYNFVRIVMKTFYACLNFLLIILIVGVVAGVIIYAKVKPMYEEAANTAYDKLSTLKEGNFHMLANTKVYDKDGKKIGEIDAGDYMYTDITEISEWVQKGYIATEDKRFREHFGIDIQSLTRAGLSLIKNNGTITQGGSTITQQVIKNNVLTQEQTYSRKLVEVLLAPRIEQRFSKDKIMEFYVNTCYYGNRCYGIQTASKYYFGKKCSDLTIAEAAMLCGVSNSPNNYNPVASKKLANEKKRQVLANMLKRGFITTKQYNREMKRKIKLKIQEGSGTNENYMVSYALHCTALELMKKDGFEFKYVFENAKDESDYNKRYSEMYQAKSALVRSGGYKIYTSFNRNLQDKLQKAIDKDLAVYKEKQKNKKYALQGASVCIDNRTGYVVAIVGGRGKKDEFNRAFLSSRQPGSTIKPLLDYAPAINEGIINPSTIIHDGVVYDKSGTYSPKNSGGHYYGNVSIREGLARSLNTVAFQVYNKTGAETSIGYLDKLHFTSMSYADNTAVALSLGGFTYGCKVVEMARGYSTLAMSGQYTSRTCLKRVVHETEGVLYKEVDLDKSQSQVYSTDTAFMMTDALQGGIEEDYGTGKSIRRSDMIIAGKTGTTSSNKDAWFCGYTKYYTTAVWVGYDTPRVMSGMYGGTVPAQIWSDYMVGIKSNRSSADFDIPETIGLRSCHGGTYSGSVIEVKQEEGGKREYKLRKSSQEWYSEQNKKQYETYQKDTKLLEELHEAKVAISLFEEFFIASVEDCYAVDKKYAECLNTIENVSDEYKQTKYKKRAAKHYAVLTGDIMKKWKKAISEYKEAEKKKEAERLKTAADDSKNSALARLKQDRINTAEWYLSMMANRQYNSSVTRQLVVDAKEAIERLKGYSEYSSYKSRYDAQASRCSGLPNPPKAPTTPQDDKDYQPRNPSNYPEDTVDEEVTIEEDE